jgi:DNA repair exonuclease SbcCD ATPase subunit
MVNEISNRSVFTLLAQSRTKIASPFGDKNKHGLQENLLHMIAEKDPDKADAFKQKLEEWERTTDMLEAAKKDFSEQRKTAAREKIEQIKKELQMLRMLAVTNPKAAARRLAQLSRELSAAVKAYSSASGVAGLIYLLHPL